MLISDTRLKQQVIDVFLAKTKKSVSTAGCCCPGPSKINGFKIEIPPYFIQLRTTCRVQRLKFIRLVSNFFKIALDEAKNKVDNKDVRVFSLIDCNLLLTIAQQIALDVIVIRNATGFFPVCACAMSHIVELNNKFYKVISNSNSNKVTGEYTVICIGDVGGPYLDGYFQLK